MDYGYARVSTTDQKLTAQINAIVEKGVLRKNIFKEKKTGRNAERDELNKLLEIILPGDKVVVTKIDRIARSLKDGLHIFETIQEKGASIEILNMGGQGGIIDSSPMGKMVLRIMLTVAEFEVDLIKERQMEGIAIAKAKGLYKGRPKKISTKSPSLLHAIELYQEGKYSVNKICDITKISRRTFYRRMEEMGITREQSSTKSDTTI